MKLVLTLAAVAALSACALPENFDKKAAADAAVAQIQAANAAGFDPINLPPEQVATLSGLCELVKAFYPDVAEDIALACAAIVEAAK
ncbi:MAG: hypothetical protein ACPG4X_16915 [Pikeienuella sp.]